MSIFGQLGKIVSGSGAQEAPKPGDSAYLESLEQSKEEAQEKVSGLFLELGRAYYERHAEDSQAGFPEQLAAIRSAYEEIAQYQQQAVEVALRQRCPACGAKLADGSMFCNICGRKLPDIPVPAAAGGQERCPQCQAAIGPEDVFCTACGANLRSAGEE